MIRLPTLFWLLIVSTAGFAMFAVKYEVQSVADQLARTIRQADDTEREIRVLDAEWAFLNRPDALAQMNQRLLLLGPIATKQLRTNIADVAMRPVPLPAPPPSPPPPAPIENIAADGAAVVAQAATAQDQPQSSTPPAAAVPAQQPEIPKPVLTAALETQTAARPVRSAVAKASFHSAPPHRAGSLNELIAQIAESH
jgi:hypothetical protein